jgi:hypothetical protein
MKAIANSNPEKAIIKDKGNKPKKKYNIPDVIILYVNPLNILSSICPAKTLAANLNPSETFLAKYEINSIKTKIGTSPKGHPAGTNKEKKTSLCSNKPKIVAPNTTVKLIENVNTK